MDNKIVIKKDYMLREVAGHHIVVAIGQASKEFRGIINLNSTGAFLWKKLQTPTSTKELIEHLLNEYEVDEMTAKNDVEAFLEALQEANLLE